jgi:hypothetical protein
MGITRSGMVEATIAEKPQRGESWSIEQLLELPNTVTGTSLQAWAHWNDPPARLRVLLQTAEGIDAIALLTRLQGTGGQATYRCEGLRRGRVRLLGSAATAGARLLLSNGNEEVELPSQIGQRPLSAGEVAFVC